MNVTVRATMARNHGLITRPELFDAGVPARTIHHLIRTGALVPVRRGVYTDGELWSALDDDRGRPRLRTRAALRMMKRRSIVSHDSAGHERELEL